MDGTDSIYQHGVMWYLAFAFNCSPQHQQFLKKLLNIYAPYYSSQNYNTIDMKN
jgi:hypothetical protein